METELEKGQDTSSTSTDIDPLTLVWAKSEPFHLLWRHLLDVGAVAAELFPIFGGVEGFNADSLAFLTASHDLGKADPLFQSKDIKCAQPLRDLGLILDHEFASATGFRHEARTAEWARKWLQNRGWDRNSRNLVAAAWRGHHGNFSASACDETEFQKRQASWNPLRERLMAIVARATGGTVDAAPDFKHADVAGMRLTALIVLADWIASSTETFPYPELDARFPQTADPEAMCEEYYRAAREAARKAVARLQFAARTIPRPADAPPIPPTFADIWPSCTRLRASQAALESVCREQGIQPGLVVLEAPMGEGKTEAAVYLAEYWAAAHNRQPGLYFALPTQATSNSLHERYRTFLGDRTRQQGVLPPRLVHGMAWLRDDLTPERPPRTYGAGEEEDPQATADAYTAHRWFENARRALLAPEAVGTVDQALLAALNVKFGFLRLLGLSRKTLVVDEVHAYDAYMTTLLERLLAWCRALGTPVILLSATLTAAQKRRLIAAYTGTSGINIEPSDREAASYPLLTCVTSQGEVREIPAGESTGRQVIVETHPGLLHDGAGIAALARKCIAAGGCACVLVNTVAMAQAVYRELNAGQAGSDEIDPELFLFHARFRAGKRQELEMEILARFGKGKDGRPENPCRPTRAILVATQVVEQSLDVDFDVFLSALAPMDLLLQRSGRLHRHSRPNRPTGPVPTFHILLPEPKPTPDFGTTGRVYRKEPLLRTLALLDGRSSFDLPGEFRLLVERAYAEGVDPIPGIAPEVLQAAVAERIAAHAAEESAARDALIPPPNPRVFVYAQQEKAREEQDEGMATSYVHARTRIGDETVPCVVLTTQEAITAFRNALKKTEENTDWWPRKSFLTDLFRQKVSLPYRWVERVTPAPGFDAPLTDSPRWLRWHTVLFLLGGIWRGTDRDGKPFILTDDPKLGLYRQTGTLGDTEETTDATT